MRGTRADMLTVVVQSARRTRTRTYTNVRYGMTWDRLNVVHADGSERSYDRANIFDMQAATSHSTAPAMPTPVPGKCALCGREMFPAGQVPAGTDPNAEDCGGECRGCIHAIEEGTPFPAHA